MSGRVCPCCLRPAAYRVPRRLDEEISLERHYRCGTRGRWLYLHTIPLRRESAPEVEA
jgi:hypothetical protein